MVVNSLQKKVSPGAKLRLLLVLLRIIGSNIELILEVRRASLELGSSDPAIESASWSAVLAISAILEGVGH